MAKKILGEVRSVYGKKKWQKDTIKGILTLNPLSLLSFNLHIEKEN